MRRPLSSYRVARTLALASIVVVATTVACDMQSPAQPASQAARKPNAAPILMPANVTYKEFQVEQGATPAAGTAYPRYPDVLRRSKVEGEVLVQFVVRPDGKPEVESLKVLKSSHDLFTQAVRNALPQMRFNPARVGGKAVSQLVTEPFSFSISK